eukprot:CAMPEP_0182597440 /NCGR_PEP_ID=MMETSP1324-20130603/86242_1 /TAXON_ID=236786 /ORGANISM="Florenciella sp., Strain RCC1587" /LENGTH=58 /DNA_ID=CAMNT_0024815183 /DNA_START=21 /DNA_END=194 /DNA_ORIENTATION=-
MACALRPSTLFALVTVAQGFTSPVTPTTPTPRRSRSRLAMQGGQHPSDYWSPNNNMQG